MKKSLIALAVLASLGASASTSRGRAMTHDAAFKYRMNAGFPGDVNRTHPASIVPALQDPTTPVRLYGDPVLFDATNNSIKGFVAADTGVTKIKGVLVRPYPTQQQSGGMSSSIGAAAPGGARTVQDYIEDGFVLVKCNNAAAGAPTKGGAVFVWCAASAGNDVQGGFTGRASTGNTAAIANAEFTGPADADGIAEIRVWK